jgi:hypothetical protein
VSNCNSADMQQHPCRLTTTGLDRKKICNREDSSGATSSQPVGKFSRGVETFVHFVTQGRADVVPHPIWSLWTEKARRTSCVSDREGREEWRVFSNRSRHDIPTQGGQVLSPSDSADYQLHVVSHQFRARRHNLILSQYVDFSLLSNCAASLSLSSSTSSTSARKQKVPS